MYVAVSISTRATVSTLAMFLLACCPALAEGLGGSRDDEPAKLSAAFRQAAERAQPSIVTIETFSGPRETSRWARRTNPAPTSSSADEYIEDEPAGARDGESTGIIIDESGYILTCNHVVDGTDMLFVQLQDGRRFEVKKVLQDPFTDVAVVQISGAAPLPVAELAADAVQVGDWVITIGNPYGLGVSMSGGVVSATRRYMPHLPYTPLIQTDAATNPGNSGGALVDLRGKVVGMSEGGYGAHEGFQGIGFAIPISLAAKVAHELIEKGSVTRPYFGLETEELTVDMRRHLGLEKKGGLIVCDVAPNSAADDAGVQVGDVLTKVGDSFIKDRFQFFELVDGEPPLPPVSFTVLRAGNEIKIEVVPEALSPTQPGGDAQETEKSASEHFDEMLGVAVDVLTTETAKRLDYNAPVDGLLVTYVDPEGVAAKQGICAGMSLLRVNGRKVRTAQEYRTAMQEGDMSKGILLLIGTTRTKHFVLCEK